MVAVVTATAVICVVNSVTLPDFGLLLHEFGGEDRVACINMRLIGDTRYGLASPDVCPSPRHLTSYACPLKQPSFVANFTLTGPNLTLNHKFT